MIKEFNDGAFSTFNKILNDRDATRTTTIDTVKLTMTELENYFISGLGSKILRLKASYSLENTLVFESEDSEKFYNAKLKKDVKSAVRYMLGFGRGALLVFNPGDDLSKPLAKVNRSKVSIRVFSGAVITAASTISLDLNSDRYRKPMHYLIYNELVHHSRIIDFTYYEPSELKLPFYEYGGVSEFQLIHDALISDAIVHRAGANIVERSANLVYKLKDFKRALSQKKSEAAAKFVAITERFRTIAGATIIDADDSIESVSQTIPNYSDIETSMLRRVATVTSIPYPILVGESVKGLNSTGEQERQSFTDAIKSIQDDYLHGPLNSLASILSMGEISFVKAQGVTALEQVSYEKICIENAINLHNMQEDAQKYLVDKAIIIKDNFNEMFAEQVGNKEPDEAPGGQKDFIELFNNANSEAGGEGEN